MRCTCLACCKLRAATLQRHCNCTSAPWTLCPHAPAQLDPGAALGRFQFDEAVSCCDKELEIEPSYFQVHFNRGNVLDALKRPVEVPESYSRSIAIEPNILELYYNRVAGLRR